MRTVVLAAPGRAERTAHTIARLHLQNPGQSFELHCSSGQGGIVDFWQMLREHAAGYIDDLLALEDDIITARNFLAYAARWWSGFMTSFFFVGGGGLQTGRAESPATFGCSQAVWFPAGLVNKLAADGPPAGARLQDDALATALDRMGGSVLYHRSLVQHLEGPSLARPGRGREWIVASDFVGEDFDCLSLL